MLTKVSIPFFSGNGKWKMHITDTLNESFETVSTDTGGPLKLSNNYRYIITLQCELTKYIIAYPVETKEAKSISRVLVEEYILKYGSFKALRSDRGTQFVNEIMKEFCSLLKIEQKCSPPYHHQSIGSLER